MTGRPWGYYLAGQWRELPKPPLQMAGYTAPPFDVTRPDGTVVRVAEKEMDDGETP